MKGKFLIQVNVAFGTEQQLGAVPGNIYMHCDFFFSRPKVHFLALHVWVFGSVEDPGVSLS